MSDPDCSSVALSRPGVALTALSEDDDDALLRTSFLACFLGLEVGSGDCLALLVLDVCEAASGWVVVAARTSHLAAAAACLRHGSRWTHWHPGVRDGVEEWQIVMRATERRARGAYTGTRGRLRCVLPRSVLNC